MFARLSSGALLGVDAQLIEVQCDVSGGLPSFQVVGLPEKEVSESRERIRSAIRNSGFSFPPGRVTANLAPADLRKGGVALDLPIALAILIASGQVPVPARSLLHAGELSLDGDVRSLSGILPLALAAVDAGLTGVVVPEENANEAAMAREIAVFPVRTLRDAVQLLKNGVQAEPHRAEPECWSDDHLEINHDLAEVRGQMQAKRALEIAAAGGHNLLMMGPPGAGKSMLAHCLPEILPPLSFEEALEVTKIYSVAGRLGRSSSLIRRRPYRSPHHTVSYAGMVGGGHGVPHPGEITLAHRGVLFLDELPEFDRRVLETLRQPLEERTILLARAGLSIRFPAAFMLVAAMNPCPCGHWGDALLPCTCSPADIRRYRKRISGPLLDRIDLFVEVPRLPVDDLLVASSAETSIAVRERIGAARGRQWDRADTGTDRRCNADLVGAELRRQCRLEGEAERLMRRAAARFALTGRGHARALRVARTIADLDAQEKIGADHLAEALGYRSSKRLLES